MDIVFWLIAGAVVGWLSFAFAGLNEERGRTMSMLIGAGGGFIGGKVIGPMVGVAAGSVSTMSMLIAILVAAAFLAAGNLIHNRWGV